MVETLVGKIAVDKHNEKLGKIIRIDDLIGKVKKEYESFAIILVRKFLKSDVHVPLETSKLQKIEGQTALFDILKTEFDELTQVHRILQNERKESGDYVRFREKWYGPGHARLAPRDRQRRKE
jgi:hypothetical protein